MPPLDSSKKPSPSAAASAPGDIPDFLPASPHTPARQSKTDASAKQYAAYTLGVVEYAYAIRDEKPVRALLAPKAACPVCDEAEQDLAGNDYYQVPKRLPRPKHSFVVDRKKGRYVVAMKFDMPGGRKFNDSGKAVDTIGPAPDSYFEAHLSWGHDHWWLENYNLKYGGQ